MADSFDERAKAAARRKRGEPDAPAEGLSRRGLLRNAGRAGAVGVGVLWVAPVIETITAQSAAATSVLPAACQTTNTCGFDAVCTAGTQCLSGVCTSGKCAKSANFGACAANVDCSSGTCSGTYCTAGALGAACTSDSQCNSNSCANGGGSSKFCQPGKAGAGCDTGTDCESHVCNGTTHTCTTPAIPGATGQYCGGNSDCGALVSNGICGQSGKGYKVCG